MGEHRVPVGHLSACGGLPEMQFFGVIADLEHVVAATETQPFQRQFQRIGPGAAEAGPDQPQRHDLEHIPIKFRRIRRF